MKSLHSLIIVLLVFAGCSTPPRPAHSSFFRAEVAGYTWKKDGAARAAFSLAVLEATPRPIYVEALLPTPDGIGDSVRKTISAGDSTVSFDGSLHSGWQSGRIYVFSLRAFADPAYRELIGSLEQRSLCSKPPESLLKQLKDE